MDSTREKIDNLIVEADSDFKENDIPSGLQKLEIAKQMATELEWDERIGTIKSLIEDVNKKMKIQEEHDKKLKEIEKKKLEKIEKDKQLFAASQRLQDRKKEQKQQKLEALKKKKESEDKLSSEAYDLLETGSKALLKDDYQKGIDSFTQALEKFKTIRWSAEVNRTQELLNDAEGKSRKYQQKLKDDEIKAEQVWEAQKKTQETIELSRQLQEQKIKEQESIEMEVKKEELLKKEKSDKALSLLDDAIQYRNINQFDSAIKAYEVALELFKEIGWQKEAIEVKEEIGLTNKQREKLEYEKKKLEEDLIKKRLEEEEIEKRASESHKLKESKEQEERNKRQRELEILSQKEEKLKEILANISIIENLVSKYEDQVHLGKILSSESPYSNAIEIYGEGSQKLREIGLIEQADRLAEGENTYKKKIFEDDKLREAEKKRLEKVKLDEEEIEKKTSEAQKIREEKLRIEKEKRQKELEEISKKNSALKDVLKDISIIEEVISGYEGRVGLGKILSLECPYPKAVELYHLGSQKLREIGLIEQADRLEEGGKEYKQKIADDEHLRELEKQRLEKVRQDKEEIERKTQESLRLREEKAKLEKEKRQNELEKITQKESQLKEILANISEMEEIINLFENQGDFKGPESPYPEAIELYSISSKKLSEIGFHEHAKLLKDGEISYKQKLIKFDRTQEEKIKHSERMQKQEEEIEEKAKEAQRIKELKEKELRDKRQQELETLSKKESKLKDVLGDISKIEDVVNEYTREVGLGRILSLECPYPKAVELYNIGTNKLREIGLIEQANNLDEGRKTYERKIIEDQKLRELENQRIEKTRLEIEEFERKAAESHKIKELKDTKLREKRQKELEAISQKESKLKNVLGDISKIENVVNEYAKEVGLGKILSLECPYSKAVELYNIGTQKLREAGLIEQANSLDEGRKTYEIKIAEDKRLRELEKQRLTKIEIDKEKLEMQAHVAEKLKEIKQKEKSVQEKKEQDKLSGQREILTETLNTIARIEKQVKKYEDQVGLGKILSTKCPYSNTIEIYRESSEKLKQIGLLEQSKSLNDGYILYKEKLIMDERNRKFEEESIRKDQESKLDLEHQILSSHKQKEALQLQKEEEKAAIHNKLRIEQDKANKAFSLMDEGNKFAANFKFDEAIERFQEAMDIFDEIKWLAELDKVLLQISIFRKQQDQMELEKIETEELKVKKQKEMEEIDKIVKLSWEKKSEEERKKSEIEQSIIEEKRKQWELEFQGKIEEDKKKREIEEQQRLEQLKREQEIGLKHQNVYNDCLELLDQAKTMVTEQQFEPAINIYKNVTEKYKEINYSEGIRITNESILKVQKLWDDHKFDIEIAQKSMKERKDEEKRLERLIKDSKQKDERKKLLAEQKKLKLQLEKEKEANVQNEIVSILEIAGDLALENQFDKALEYYDKTLKLFKSIDWDLKYKQILSIIQDTTAKKKHFGKLQKQFEDKQKKDQKAQKAFKDFLEKQETERKSKGEKIKKLTDQQKMEQKRRITLEDASYEYIDQAENCVKGRKYYLSLYYFHYALNNFIEIEWAREAKALKKRFLQVYNLISSPLIDINEILSNPKLDLEYHYANSLSLILLAQKRKDFLVAQTELKTVNEMAKNLKWPKSLKLLEEFMEILEKEKEDYKKEIEMKKYAPTEGKALNLMKEASAKIKNKEFDEGIALANKAKEIYIQMSIEREARKVEQELLRWKLKQSRYMLNQQREKSKAIEPDKKTFLSEDERKNLIIEERKRRRREARKKLMGD